MKASIFKIQHAGKRQDNKPQYSKCNIQGSLNDKEPTFKKGKWYGSRIFIKLARWGGFGSFSRI